MNTKKKPEFKYFTYFYGEVTVYRSKDEFKSVKHKVIHRLKDLKSISDLAKISENEINKAWYVDDTNAIPVFEQFQNLQTLQWIINTL